MSITNQPTLRTPTEGRTIAVVGDVYRFLATGDDTNGKYAMWEAVVPPGGGPPPHVQSGRRRLLHPRRGDHDPGRRAGCPGSDDCTAAVKGRNRKADGGRSPVRDRDNLVCEVSSDEVKEQ